MNEKVSHIIFDLDGTLADTAILTMEAFRRVAPRVGLPVPSIETVRSAIGYANPEFYHHIYPNEQWELVRHAGGLVEREELELLPQMEHDLLFPGVRKLLQTLCQRGILLYIASTGDPEHVSGVLDHAGIRSCFYSVHCGQPDKTEMIRGIMGENAPDLFLMVGDMAKDCQGAHANGITAIGACYGYCVQGKDGFDRHIHTPLELLSLL